MAAPGEPPTSTQTEPDASPPQTADTTVPDRIPLPPPTAAPPQAPPRRRRSWLDAFFVLLVVGFAFLVASTPARNSDLWLHLAAGRALVHGQYHFGVDPFAQGTENAYWVNTNWLYDVLTYAVFQGLGGLGGAALVLLKAVLVGVLGLVLVRLGWCGRGLWAPAVGAAWAVLVLSPWLMLHPMIVSYLFLALTIYFLERPHRPAPEDDLFASKPVSFVAYWPLLPLFALWANLDAWFLLGPLTVALYLIGQVLQTKFGPDRDGRAVGKGETAALGLALPACLAACLLNPHGVYAFLTPPAQLGLSPAAHILEQDAAFQGLRLSPFQSAYYYNRALGWTAAGLAFYPLALLGALSFVANFAGWRWRRALVWLALFLLAALQVRAVPFFAVVAGPLLALNVQEFLGRRYANWTHGGEAARWAAAGRVLSLLGGLALLAGAWSGWLHAGPYEPPRWAVEVDPSIRNTAETIGRWREKGLLGADDIGFNVSTDAANYFAWFCPSEKGVFDARHPLFSAAAAADMVQVRKELSAPEEPKTAEDARDDFFRQGLWPENGADPGRLGGAPMDGLREVMRRRGADHIILYDNDAQAALLWMERLQHYPAEWPLLYLDGRAAVFGWRDPEAVGSRGAFADLTLDLNRLAFHPPDDRKAPPEWPGREPRRPDWDDAFLKYRAARSPQTDEAHLYLLHFDKESPRYQFRTETAWGEAVLAGAVGTAACVNGSVVAPYETILRLHVLTAHPTRPVAADQPYRPTPVEQLAYHFHEDYLAHQDQGPTALLYLGIRAARRAVHDNPDDPQAYLVLGEAYRRMLQNTKEQAWNPPQRLWDKRPPRFPLLYRVRGAQAAAAYAHALVLNPNLEQAHMGLISLYQDLNYQDEVLVHLKEVLRCNEVAGRRPGETAEQFREHLLYLRDLVDKKDKDVAERLDKFEVKSAGMSVFQKAETAWQEFGLAGKALSILLASDVSVFDRAGMAMELELLLHTGRTAEVRDWPDAVKARDLLGAQRYLEVQVQLAAASGDYRQADDDLEDLAEGLHAIEADKDAKVPVRAAAGFGVGQALLEAAPQDGYQSYLIRTSFFLPEIVSRTRMMANNLSQEADLLTLRGLLAVESGEVGRAEGLFRDAVAVWGGDNEARLGGGLDFPSRVVAQDALKTLSGSEPAADEGNGP